MENTYTPLNIEMKWYEHWEKAGYFTPSGKGPAYCIMIPPPNVTGFLHMGHGFQQTLMDILIRYHRMQGDNTLWQVGTDHAGIATQMVVERKLAAEDISRQDIGRKAFEEKVWEWKAESGGQITKQMRRIGNSIDWSRERFTMDPDLSEAVKEVFIRLHKEGLIYRGHRLVNWDPVLQTAISDVEVLNEERQGFLYHLKYPLDDTPENYLIVATTRPETLLGDAAVAVHPEDSRYQHLIGKYVRLPLTDRKIPIIADSYVDMSFGTGCVKITPAHDFNDYEVGLRHSLPLINIFTPTATLNDNTPKAYQGLDRFVAREKVIKEVEALGLLESIKPHTLQLPIGERGGAVIEPYLTEQWYVSMKSLAAPAIAAVREKKIRFIPENWENTYFQWMENIEDWCISRQLWWGHRIPAWYDETGKVYVGESEAAVRKEHGLSETIKLRQDNDVLDTWFSSALWPFATLGWPQNTVELKSFYPTQALITGFDIIFFWVARMIMFGLKFMGQVPFEEVYITGLIRDEHGQKMSKTKGNVLDPIDLVDGISLEDLLHKRTYGLMQTHLVDKIRSNTKKQFPQGIAPHGMDALRFSFASLASTGRDIRFDLGRLEGYRNFCNKIWNATKFVLMNVDMLNKQMNGQLFPVTPAQAGVHKAEENLTLPDLWIEVCFQNTVREVRRHLDNYRFDMASEQLYNFMWKNYCDWYLEIAKAYFYDKENIIKSAQKISSAKKLLSILESYLRLLHPFMPFITEEIWQALKPYGITGDSQSIMLAPYPDLKEETSEDKKTIKNFHALSMTIEHIRQLRSTKKIPPNKTFPVYSSAKDQEILSLLQNPVSISWIKSLAKLSDFSALPSDADKNLFEKTSIGVSMMSDIGIEYNIALDIYFPKGSNNAIDQKAQEKELAQLQKGVEALRTKLDNPEYLAKAPPMVVEKDRQKLKEYQRKIEELEQP
jgi:valyl-tRNA synthetase